MHGLYLWAECICLLKRIELTHIQTHRHTNTQTHRHLPFVLVLVLVLVDKPDSSKLLRQKRKTSPVRTFGSSHTAGLSSCVWPLQRSGWRPLTLHCRRHPARPETPDPDPSHTQSSWGWLCPAGWPPAGLGCRGRRATSRACPNLRRTGNVSHENQPVHY